MVLLLLLNVFFFSAVVAFGALGLPATLPAWIPSLQQLVWLVLRLLFASAGAVRGLLTRVERTRHFAPLYVVGLECIREAGGDSVCAGLMRNNAAVVVADGDSLRVPPRREVGANFWGTREGQISLYRGKIVLGAEIWCADGTSVALSANERNVFEKLTVDEADGGAGFCVLLRRWLKFEGATRLFLTMMDPNVMETDEPVETVEIHL